MLVIPRKRHEAIKFGNRYGGEVTVIVLQVTGDHVIIGIESGPSDNIMRGEVYDKRKDQASNLDTTVER